jgi:hypothetical protein
LQASKLSGYLACPDLGLGRCAVELQKRGDSVREAFHM